MKKTKKKKSEKDKLIEDLRRRLWEKDAIVREMRMSLYYVKKFLGEIEDELDGMWLHHLDGSDLLVSKSELFDVIQNKIIRVKLHRGIGVVNKPLKKLKEFIGW